MKTLNFSFYPYLRPSAAGKSGVPVYMRLSHQGLRKDYSLNLKIDPRLWDDEFKQVRGRSKEASHQNLRLKQEMDKVQEAIRDLYDEFGQFSLDQLYARIRNGNKPIQVLDFFQEVMRDNELRIQAGDLARNTQKVYRTTFKHLSHFINTSLNRNDFPLKSIDYTFLQKLQWYFKGSKGLGQNSNNKYLKTLKAVINEARKRKIIKDYPFQNFPLKSGEYDRTTCTVAEIQKIQSFEPKNLAQQVARDFFLFAAYTGMHFADIKNLRMEHIHTEGEDQYIKIHRQKNHNPTIIPLLPQASAIINAHAELPRRNYELLLLYSNQKVNYNLKLIAKECGIEKNLTCKVARHTYATIALNKGISLEKVGTMLGHTNTRTTRLYAKMSHEGLKSIKPVLSDLYSVGN